MKKQKTPKTPGDAHDGKLPREAKDTSFNGVPSTAIAAALGYDLEKCQVQDVPTKLALTKQRLADRLFLVKSGDTVLYIVHIEQQSGPESHMLERMLIYRALILQWQIDNGLLGVRVRQVILYTGAGRWRLKRRLRLDGSSFLVDYLDAKDLDPAPFLNSDKLDGVIFAVLCRGGTEPDVLRQVLAQVKPLPSQQRGEIIVKLGAWCDARNSMALLRRELDEMDIDIENNPLVREITKELAERVERETAERVERKTLTDAIVTVLRGRFPRKLPAHLRQRLATYSLEHLREIMKRSAVAESATEALDVAPDSSPSIAPR